MATANDEFDVGGFDRDAAAAAAAAAGFPRRPGANQERTPDDDGWPDLRVLADALRTVLLFPNNTSSATAAADLAAELVVGIDRVVGRQVAMVMHHPRFRRLEAAWRGVAHVCRTLGEDASRCRVKVAHYGPDDMAHDLRDAYVNAERVGDLGTSWLHRELYRNTLDMLGGRPIGIVVSGIEFGGDVPDPTDPSAAVWPADDPDGGLGLLRRVAAVAAVGFCPFVASASPRLFDAADFAALPDDPEIARDLRPAWDALRATEDARFVGLVAPRVVLRPPLADLPGCGDWFRWPSVDHPGLDDLCHRPLLGGGAYALAAVVARSMRTGWPSDIMGVTAVASVAPAGGEPEAWPSAQSARLDESGGLSPLTADDFPTDRPGVCFRAPLEVTLTLAAERRLGRLGFLVVSRVPLTGRAAFYSLRMVADGTAEAWVAGGGSAATRELHTLLPYLLTASRFAQLVKKYGRMNTGVIGMSTQDLQAALANEFGVWHVGPGKPLRQSPVVRATSMRDGVYEIELQIAPRAMAEDVEVEAVMPMRVRLTGSGL